MKTLLAGPWVGEFGWELMGWQGIVRRIAYEGGYEKVVIGAYEGHDVLYADFATEMVTLKHQSGNTSGWTIKGTEGEDGVWYKDRDVIRFHKAVIEKYNADEVYSPCEGRHRRNRTGKMPQKFVKYGKENQVEAFDVVVHARNTSKWNSGVRNWKPEKWNELMEKLGGLRVASIGTVKEAICVPGTCERRGISLAELADLMASSKLVIGPSSGPMHFASLCGCTHVVWTDTRRQWIGCSNRERYERKWNPLGTKAIVIDHQGWQPEVGVVLDAIQKELR